MRDRLALRAFEHQAVLLDGLAVECNLVSGQARHLEHLGVLVFEDEAPLQAFAKAPGPPYPRFRAVPVWSWLESVQFQGFA